jgi:uncharacterized cupredoxin-like copper-binding protein
MTVTGTEMAFSAPDHVVAGRYNIFFRNDGAIVHELAVSDSSGTFVGRRSVEPGQTVTFEVKLTPGSWELSCHEPGHFEGGMHRPLVVDPS